MRSVQAERSAAEAEEQKQTFLSDVQNSEAKLKEYSDSAAQVEKSLAEVGEKRSATANKLAGYQRLNDGKVRRMNEAKSEAEKVRSELDMMQNRYKVLDDVEKNMEGYNRSVKELMKASQQGRMSGIHGTVADVVTIDERYVLAIGDRTGSGNAERHRGQRGDQQSAASASSRKRTSDVRPCFR